MKRKSVDEQINKTNNGGSNSIVNLIVIATVKIGNNKEQI